MSQKNQKEIRKSLNNLEAHALECFERNHKCSLIKAMLNSYISEYTSDKFKEHLFELKQAGTGVGTVTIVTCEACEEGFNVTDYSCW